MKKKQVAKADVVKKVFTCSVCNKTGFSSTYKLNAHLFRHKKIPARHKCSYCPKTYFRSDEYTRHLASHTQRKKLFCCDHCGRDFVDKRNLILHLRVHDDLPRLSNMRYKCSACDASYCEDRLLKYHIRKKHLNFTSKEPLHVSKKVNDTWIENIKDTNNCVQITKIKTNVLSIKRFKVKYDIVSKGKKTKPLQQHVDPVFGMKSNSYYSKAICDYCNKEMLKKSIINHIRERHLKLRRFQCDVCSRTFKRHYQMCDHVCGKVRRRKMIKVKT